MQTILQCIEHHATNTPDRTFLITPDDNLRVSFTELKSCTNEIGQKLNQLGIPKGAKVAFLLNNGYWAVNLFLGVMASNRVIVPLNAVAGNVQLTHVLGHSDSEIVLVAPEYREKLDHLLQSIERDVLVIEVSENGPQWPSSNTDSIVVETPVETDTALLLYTSGSTGLPKGAILSHRAIVSGGQNVIVAHELNSTDRVLCVLPIYHINGAMVTVVTPLVNGSSVVMPARFSASSFWNLIESYQCSWSSIVPTIIKYLLDRANKEPYKYGDDSRLANFRFARSASAPLPAVVLKQWEEVFKVPMIETMGLTETAATVASNPMPPRQRKPGSVGLPFGNQINIVDDNGNVCPADTIGELVIQGDNVLDLYYKNPEATASSIIDNWLYTGDQGKKDDDGYIFITGRLKELIIRGGENIAPREIDDILYKHEAILEAAAVGVDHEAYGQEVVACVVVREGYKCSEAELQTFCEQSIGKVKTPKTIYFFEDLPKGPSGKILRLKLPEMIADVNL
ncbi:MAG: acyl-CoA synthetase (AMP-forming)/AMP-acid ligase II [Gammaproteobacteria bacterium]|jgi:acyl-CoA synthetase (AMP-forming)/AMP-acid ligase II